MADTHTGGTRGYFLTLPSPNHAPFFLISGFTPPLLFPSALSQRRGGSGGLSVAAACKEHKAVKAEPRGG